MIDVNSLPTPQMPPGPPTASDELVMRVASEMINYGYRFNAVSLNALTDYLSGKELFLFGSVGTGKSLFFKALSECTDGIDRARYGAKNLKPYKFAVVSAETAATMSTDALRDFMLRNASLDLVIDDLGSEAPSMSFGTKYDLIGQILQHHELIGGKGRLHVTSNIKDKDIFERYGERRFDRLQLLTLHDFSSQSMRVQGAPRLFPSTTDSFRVFGYWQSPTDN